MRKMLVIGGRSKIGSALIGELLSRGEDVRALARSGEGDAFAAGVDVAGGDLADPASLDAAVRGVEKVFLLCGPAPDEVEFNRNAIDAVRRGGVAFVVRSSILGADAASASTFRRDHGRCDDYLRSSGIAHAILRPNMFMQNVPESTIPSIGADGVFYANAGGARISMVDTRDVAAVAAVLLSEPGSDNLETVPGLSRLGDRRIRGGRQRYGAAADGPTGAFARRSARRDDPRLTAHP